MIAGFQTYRPNGMELPSGSEADADGNVLGEDWIDRLVGRWWVLHTKPRNEKALGRDLSTHRAGWFLPLVRRRRTYGRRSVQVEVPLFPGYLFLCGDLGDRLVALQTHRVVNVLEVADQEGLRADLSQVYRAISGDKSVDLYPGIRTGRRCRVNGGSFAGIEGVVIRRRNVWRVFVAVHVLGQSVELEVDTTLVELID